jgi:hypothetical protein
VPPVGEAGQTMQPANTIEKALGNGNVFAAVHMCGNLRQTAAFDPVVSARVVAGIARRRPPSLTERSVSCGVD